ncbi:hypothetical protein BXZ70DRAFT_989113 [Cristinia sonorae]|uniref:NUC153 domain-containing protein n=1 Tax=Cristinia sonorae TaxID=1940300 RepID=A0A8K0UPL7_9AGAR|nr:hypothetical protein BXZ70DRAFT_989113 [Cristinia sonorae]
MSDPRFARLKSDPRFRSIRKQNAKVVVDDRFKSVFSDSKKKKKQHHSKGRVDKYGRPLADTHEEDNLRRFYRLENEEEDEPAAKGPDYARGEVLLESSDEEDADDKKDDSDDDGVVVLGRDISQPIPITADETEIDLDETQFAELDAQAEAYARRQAEEDQDTGSSTEPTRRIAVVNLDWDHVRAVHLFKVFSSLVSPTAPPLASSSRSASKNPKDAKSTIVRGRILSVRIYPSQFGKERMAREEVEGPPAEIFKMGSGIEQEDDVNEITVYETGDGQDYNEDALRKYQLERLRYYYAIVECDTVEAASHVYTELDGTELERSANVFDLSFVPDDMSFDDEPRDDATNDLDAPYKGLEFVTDALRHSKVKLTWDDDDPERNQVTRRTLTKKEIEENDFRAYIASSESESEDDGAKKGASRDKLRALLLGGGDDTLPEGWGKDSGDEGDADMEITFTPGLSETKNTEETTLETYKRKMKEKKKRRKEEKEKAVVKKDDDALAGDDFFAPGSGDEDSGGSDGETRRSKGKKKDKNTHGDMSLEATSLRRPSTAEELALIAASENPDKDTKHFDMKAIIKAEKTKKMKRKPKKGKAAEQAENETQDDFQINVEDDRFKGMHEDHAFAIDPSNPHFKKTKSMTALLAERSKRLHNKAPRETMASPAKESSGARDLKSLVESVKRKSSALEQPNVGKRRKL